MALESVKRAVAFQASPQINRDNGQQTTRKVEQKQNVYSIGDYADSPATVNGGLATNNDGEQRPGDESEQERKIKAAISHANAKIRHSGKTNCEFSYNEEIRRISIKIFDSETKEVIREIPAEETLEMVEKVMELAGVLVDERR